MRLGHTHLIPLVAFPILMLCAEPAQAQSIVDYLARVQGGIGYGTLALDLGPQRDSARSRYDYAGAGVTLGFDWPLVKFAAYFGLGTSVAGRAFLAYSQSNADDLNGVAGLTFLGLLRYGSDAAWGWRPLFGAGLGLGYQYTYQEWEVKYWAPVLAVEASLVIPDSFRSVLRLRYVTEFGPTSPSSPETSASSNARNSHLFFTVTTTFGPRMKPPALDPG